MAQLVSSWVLRKQTTKQGNNESWSNYRYIIFLFLLNILYSFSSLTVEMEILKGYEAVGLLEKTIKFQDCFVEYFQVFEYSFRHPLSMHLHDKFTCN